MPAYAGAGQAKVVHMNEQVVLWQAESKTITTGNPSLAFQLGRIPRFSYPWGAAFQVSFSGAPGSFEIDIEGSETDEAGSYVLLATSAKITAVNASNFGRYDMPATFFPKFVRASMQSLANSVNTTLVLTR
jgi:hypothetical protein